MLLVGSLALIVAATTMPWSAYYVGHPHWASVEWVPFSRRVRPGDFLLNVLLFVPFGVAAAWAMCPDNHRPGPVPGRRTAAAIVAAGCLISMGVEVFQVFCHWRIPTTVDVLSNTVGAWVGVRVSRRVGPGRW